MPQYSASSGVRKAELIPSFGVRHHQTRLGAAVHGEIYQPHFARLLMRGYNYDSTVF